MLYSSTPSTEVLSDHPSPSLLLRGTPAVFAPTSTSFTVVATLRAAALVWVEYGETPELGKMLKSDGNGFVPCDEAVVKIRIPFLKPGTRYYWRLVIRAAHAYDGNRASARARLSTPEFRSEIHVTRTLAPDARTTCFVLWNDTHAHAETVAKLHALSSAKEVEFVVWNGDMSNNIDDRCLFPSLYVHPEGSNLAKGPPILPTRGNHDVRGLWAHELMRYIDFPEGRPYYAFRSGPVGVIVLDTGEDKPDEHPTFQGKAAFEPLIREQARWLEAAIQRPELRDAPYRMVVCHMPLRWIDETTPEYDKEAQWDHFSLRGRKAWHGLLVRWGAQVIVSGHTHRSEWIPPAADFPYGQLTGGGPSVEEATIIRVQADAKQLHLACERIKDGQAVWDLDFPSLD